MDRQVHDAVLRRHEKPGQSGYLYDVLVEDRVIATSRDPETAACRALLKAGKTGAVRFWREGKLHHDSE